MSWIEEAQHRAVSKAQETARSEQLAREQKASFDAEIVTEETVRDFISPYTRVMDNIIKDLVDSGYVIADNEFGYHMISSGEGDNYAYVSEMLEKAESKPIGRGLELITGGGFFLAYGYSWEIFTQDGLPLGQVTLLPRVSRETHYGSITVQIGDDGRSMESTEDEQFAKTERDLQMVIGRWIENHHLENLQAK